MSWDGDLEQALFVMGVESEASVATVNWDLGDKSMGTHPDFDIDSP